MRTRLIAIQELAAGASVGYGSRFTAEARMRIGVAACGYADGYPRLAPGDNERGTPVLVDGVRTRTVGRVSMDMIAVDLGPVPTATIGSEVVLWGRAEHGRRAVDRRRRCRRRNRRLRADVRARAARAGRRRVSDAPAWRDAPTRTDRPR